MAGAFRVRPAHHDELLPVQAFRLEPGTPVRLVATINALRDDPFEPMRVGRSVKGGSLPDLMIVVADRGRRARQQFLETRFPIDQGQRGQVCAIEEQQIEDEIDEGDVTTVDRVLDQVEGGAAIGEDAAQFAVQIGALRG